MTASRRLPPALEQIRPARPDDVPFIRAMTYEAGYWREDVPRPSLADALANPEIARYVDGWGRARDAAVVAVGSGARRLGAAWYRLFAPDQPGFGYVDADTPELAVAVVRGMRGRGIGTALLRELLCEAHRRGESRLSLSVNFDHPAVGLYRRLGFATVGQDEDSWIMLRRPPGATSGQSGGSPSSEQSASRR